MQMIPVLLLCAASSVPEDLDPEVRLAAEAILTGSAVDAGALYDLAILEQGDHAPLMEWLGALIHGGSTPAAILSARLDWRAGDIAAARATLRPLLEESPGLETRLLYARLLDAIDWTDEAIEAYEDLLTSDVDDELTRWLRLRLALMTMERGEEHRDALLVLAREEGQPVEFRNRAAICLGLLGRPADAVDLYVATEEAGTPRFRDLVRLAEWAVRAEDPERAQALAWEAADEAALTRDRAYALSVLVEAHRLDDSLPALLERLAAASDLPDEHRERWIELLRDLDRAGEAIALFTEGREQTFSRAERRELLEMFRDSGQSDRMVAEYERLIALEPRTVLWYEGLARFYLESGDSASARSLWRGFVDGPADSETLSGAEALMGLGLDLLAVECAEAAIEESTHGFAALLFLNRMHSDRGRLEEAELALARLDEAAPPDHGVRMDLAEAYERLGLQSRALETFLGLQAARPDHEQGEDMAMRLAWLFSEVDREDEAMEAWLSLWQRVESVPRRRYVEDRLMTVAARLGKLADVAVDLERKLFAGTASERESGLLVRLYTKVGDSVSATEVIEEFMKRAGGEAKDILEEKARVYVACTDYARYEDTIRELMRVDPEGEAEYLRQLAMSMLERGKPDEASKVLVQLRGLDSDSAGDEFEAGVLSLAGLHDEALRAYRIAIARHPDRIDSLLLLANVMKDKGRTADAVGMFQHLIEVAEKDDLFTIAIDGLLNMEAPTGTLRWARRMVLERLAGREGKMYLFQLYSDLSEELDDRAGQLAALEGALPIAGSRRPALLRELMDLAALDSKEDDRLQLSYGRRLIGLAEIVPPQVYLDLGGSFLRAGEIKNAAKTFRLASDQPDYARLQRQAAGLFDEQGYPQESLREYERVLVSQATDVGLMAKVAELCEQLGEDQRALELYVSGMELIHQRRPLSTGKVEEEEEDPYAWWRARNVDDYDQHHVRLRTGLLATATAEDAGRLVGAERAAILADLAQLEAGLQEGGELVGLGQHPRLLRRAQHHRRLALAFGEVLAADELDLRLLAAFPGDEELLGDLVQERATWGLTGSARRLIRDSGRPASSTRKLSFLVGEGSALDAAQRIPLDEVTRLLLPRLVAGDGEGVEALLRRADLGSVEKQAMPGVQVLFSAAQLLEDVDLMLSTGRQWIRLQLKLGSSQYQLEPILERVGAALPAEERLALYQYFISRILEDPAKAAPYIPMLPKLQSLFLEPLLSEEQIAELLDGYGERGYGWGLGPVLVLLPEVERAGALRSVWSKLQPTQRARFLIELVTDVPEPLGEDLSGFVAEVFPEALAEADDFFIYMVRQLWDEEDELPLLEQMCAALQNAKPRSWNVRCLSWIVKWRRGDIAAAVAEAGALYHESSSAPDNDYEARSVRSRIHQDLLPEHIGALLGAFDGAAAEGPSSVKLLQSRIDLVQAAGAGEQTIAAYRAAIEEHPKEVSFLEQLRRFHQRQGETVEGLRVLERIAELEPDEARWQLALVGDWTRLNNPIEALAARRRYEELSDGEPSPGTGTKRVPAVAIKGAPQRLALVKGPARPVGKPSGKVDPRKQKAATIKGIQQAADEEAKPEEARRTLRRLWRSFERGESAGRPGYIYYGWGAGRLASLAWPEPKAAPEEKGQPAKEQPAPRGGLASFREEDSRSRVERTNAWSVLAGRDWGAEEMQRFIRTFEAREIDGYQPLFEGMLSARLEHEQPAAVMDELLVAVEGQTGGRVEQILLLSLLDLHPEIEDERIEGVLDSLVGATSPVDGQQVRRLARMHLREGRLDEAVRLYRWCATQTSSVMRFSMEGTQPLDAGQLVAEAKEQLEGDSLDQVVDAILSYADPGMSRWQREQFEVLALTTWAEMYDPDEALARGREMCEAAIDPATGLRRASAKLAAGLFARAGELEKALVALEYGVTKLDPGPFASPDPWSKLQPQSSGFLSHADLRLLFPRQGEFDWPEELEWYRRAGDQLAGWLAQDRVRLSSTVDALALLTRRLVSLGDQEGAVGLASRLVELGADQELSAAKQLWVIDAALEAGLEGEAYGLERGLLAQGSLHPERLGEVVRRVDQREGAATALELGGAVAELQLHPALLEALASVAEGAGDASQAARWHGLGEQAAAAKASLKAAVQAAAAKKSKPSPGSLGPR